VFVGVAVFVGVFVEVAVLVGVSVGVLVGTSVDVFVGVDVLVGVTVLVAVNVLVGVLVGVCVLVGVFVGVCVGVAVCVGVLVGTSVDVSVGVLVLVDVLVAVGSGTSNPITFTGLLRCVVVPSPSCPAPFSPQHLIVPSIMRAQVWPPSVTPPPPVSAMTFPSGGPPGDTSTLSGVWSLPPAVPSPNWPILSNPQHSAPLVDVTTHVCMPPTARPVALPLSPITSTGAAGVSKVPSPSWPPTFHPQHLALPVDVSAHV
jgi:hypothetical protein